MMTPIVEERMTNYFLSSPITLLVYVALLDRLQNAAFSGISGNF
jgi:hypothetical protein